VHLQRQVENSERFFWHRLRWRAVREYLPKHTPFELIDVGAGAGLLGTYLRRDRPLARYRFIEPIESLGSMLRSVHGADADATSDSHFATARFVTLLDVLEHQEDDALFIEELVGKMAPGSLLLLTVPALPKLWSPWDEALGHYRRYTKPSLRACFDGLPVAVREASYLFPEMLAPGYLRARRGASGDRVDLTEDAEFPDLPGPVNDILYGLGTMSLALRRHWKAGSSLFLAAEITG
jgi:hypothetical protein